MIDKELDRLAVPTGSRFALTNAALRKGLLERWLLDRQRVGRLDRPFLVELYVKLDKEQGLISNVGEEVTFPNEVKDVGSSKAKEIR